MLEEANSFIAINKNCTSVNTGQLNGQRMQCNATHVIRNLLEMACIMNWCMTKKEREGHRRIWMRQDKRSPGPDLNSDDWLWVRFPLRAYTEVVDLIPGPSEYRKATDQC